MEILHVQQYEQFVGIRFVFEGKETMATFYRENGVVTSRRIRTVTAGRWHTVTRPLPVGGPKHRRVLAAIVAEAQARGIVIPAKVSS